MRSTARPGDSAGRRASGAWSSAAGVVVLCVGARLASANVEIGGIAGAHLFSEDSELGATDGPNAPSQRDSALFGLRVGAFAADLIGIEAELGMIPTVAREAKFGVIDLTYRAQVVLQLRAADPTHDVIPFLLLGAGGFSVVSSNHDKFKTDPLKDIAPDTDGAFYVGAGVKLRLGRSAGLRFDVRALMMPSSQNTVPADPNSQKQTLDLEGLASAYYEVGRAVAGRSAPPPPPHEDLDADGDGVRGTADRCPTEAEDKDGFQDDDGCPDPDNDFDGVADARDACPMVAEDKDGFQDDDGCPELDNDADGIADVADRCPLEAEDKDGFQDDDGCPDPDNDGDGVLDPEDACLDQLETKNGFQDTDGCPDELPPALKLVSGVVPNLGFKVNAADLAPGATKALDGIVAVLVQFPELRVAISAHTDDELLTRGMYADNQELSQARADAVMGYLVKKGIDAGRLVAKGFGDTAPAVSPSGLTGAKLKAVRAMNRRVELHLISPLP